MNTPIEHSPLGISAALEDKFFPLFQHAAVGFAMVGLNCEWLRVNCKLCEMTGYTEEELLAMTFCDITHPDDLEADLTNMKLVMAGELPINVMEKRYIRKDGSTIWIHLTATLVRDELERPTYFFTIIEDITDRKQMEASLRESEERFRTIAEAAPMMISMGNTEGKATYFNKGWINYTGKNMATLIEDGWMDFMHPDERDDVVNHFYEVFRERKPFYRELQIRNQEGEYRWFLGISVPRFNAGGEFYGYIGCNTDITELKRTQDELNDYAVKLEKSNKELEQFATIASHDLQAPLRKVIMFSDALKASSDMLSEEHRDYIDRMQRAVHRMQDLITDLLNLSRISRKGQPFRKTNIQDVVEEVKADLLYDIRREEGRIELGNLDCIIEADATQLQQLLRNLMDNGLKFRRKDVPPVVRISACGTDDGFCEITVEDNGIGFDEQYCERIFGIFERLVGASEYEGTGMGLAICHKIAERHNGSIRAQSRVGHGSTFTIRLPKNANP